MGCPDNNINPFLAIAAIDAGDAAWLALLAILLVLLIRAVWEPTSLDCVTVRIDLPESGSIEPDRRDKGFRLLLFSDLHAEMFRIRPEKLLQAFAEARPDLILFAGDLAAHDRHLPAAIGLVSQIRNLPGFDRIPFYAVRGNHDSDRAAAELRLAGVIVLENEGRTVELNGETWQIIGLEDRLKSRPDPAKALQAAQMAGIPPERRLVLAHNPDALLDLPEGSAALFLAGHFHGGQIWMPFHLEFRILRSEKLPRTGFYKGRSSWKGTPAYITRGLGCVLLPLRLFSRPELTVLVISRQMIPKSGRYPA